MSLKDFLSQHGGASDSIAGGDPSDMSDILPTHPEASGNAPSPDVFKGAEVRVKMFDLNIKQDREDLEEILTRAIQQDVIVRLEEYNADKEGFVIVTLSWIELNNDEDDEVKPEESDNTGEQSKPKAGEAESKAMDAELGDETAHPGTGMTHEQIMRAKQKEAADNARQQPDEKYEDNGRGDSNAGTETETKTNSDTDTDT